MIWACFIKLLFHTHMHTQPLLMSWLCLLAVHSMIEMGVWVLSGRKSACQLAFSALFPISIKHPASLVMSPQHYSSLLSWALLRWQMACARHKPFFKLHWGSSDTLLLMLISILGVLVDWMVEWEFERWHWAANTGFPFFVSLWPFPPLLCWEYTMPPY